MIGSSLSDLLCLRQLLANGSHDTVACFLVRLQIVNGMHNPGGMAYPPVRKWSRDKNTFITMHGMVATYLWG
jgi:hypothetical protein